MREFRNDREAALYYGGVTAHWNSLIEARKRLAAPIRPPRTRQPSPGVFARLMRAILSAC